MHQQMQQRAKLYAARSKTCRYKINIYLGTKRALFAAYVFDGIVHATIYVSPYDSICRVSRHICYDKRKNTQQMQTNDITNVTTNATK